MRSQFAQVIRTGDLLFLSGIVAHTSDLGSGPRQQTISAFMEVSRRLGEHGLTLENVVYVTGYLREPAHFDAYEGAWSETFGEAPPARTTVSSGILVDRALVELSVIASTAQVS
jgi:2-iminobutanoate/2-iminopropanoate deaminase